MIGAKTERGSILMETVIVIPIIMLVFTFIWEFAQHARDQLFVAEIGLSAARLVGAHVVNARRKDFPDAQKYKDHLTAKYAIAPVGTGDLGKLNDVATSDTLCVRDWVAANANAPWTMIVGSRAWYSGSHNPENKPLWMKIAKIYSSNDRRQGQAEPEVRATVARVMTYMLTRTGISYLDKYPRHLTANKLAGSTKHWQTSNGTPYVHLPNHDRPYGNQGSWVRCFESNTQVRNDNSLGARGVGSMDGYERNRTLDFISKAQP